APPARRGDPQPRSRARRRPLARRGARRPGRDPGVPFRDMSELSHVDEPAVRRRAVARAVVRMAPETVAQLGNLPKGDALTTAQIAGIMAAKRTSELVPLCHPLPLTHVGVELRVAEEGVE